MNLLVFGGCLAVLLAVCFALLMRKVLSPASAGPMDPEWLQQFTVDAYRPMLRLLDPADEDFLKAQPGYEPGLCRQLRQAHRRILRSYLRNLGRDFGRLHCAARLLLPLMPEDRPDLAVALLRQSFRFWTNMAMVRVRLELHVLGIGSLDLRGLIQPAEWMQGQVAGFLPANA